MVVYDFVKTRELIVGRQDGDGSSASAPTVAFGDGDTGFYESADDEIGFSLGGNRIFAFSTTKMTGNATSSFSLVNETASSTNPTLLPSQTDLDTGVGWAGGDALELIAGGIAALELTESSNNILITWPGSMETGITAFSGGGQGSAYQLTRAYSIVTIVAANQDSVKMPASFVAGTIMHVFNADAAQTIDVFPGSGDDIGAGANNAINVGIGKDLVLIGTVNDTTWARIGGSA